ncbi:uncharacterized protein LOC116915866 [Daphnia magna]|uniref:uncharacterized protein LOC116915866 n=1 Tax=Daphnia magna TaxID=35525 RepID=UPI001E1BC9D6|nr:uncharacterized protein LOC116915866 [Daphnia magna]
MRFRSIFIICCLLVVFEVVHQVTADQSDRWNFKRPLQAFSEMVLRYRHAFTSKMSPKRKNFVNLRESHHPAQWPWLSAVTSPSSDCKIAQVDKFYRVSYPINQAVRDYSPYNEEWRPKVQQQFRSVWSSADEEKNPPKSHNVMNTNPFWPEDKTTGYKGLKSDKNLMALEHFRLRCEMLMDPYDCIYSSQLNRLKYKY